MSRCVAGSGGGSAAAIIQHVTFIPVKCRRIAHIYWCGGNSVATVAELPSCHSEARSRDVWPQHIWHGFRNCGSRARRN